MGASEVLKREVTCGLEGRKRGRRERLEVGGLEDESTYFPWMVDLKTEESIGFWGSEGAWQRRKRDQSANAAYLVR